MWVRYNKIQVKSKYIKKAGNQDTVVSYSLLLFQIALVQIYLYLFFFIIYLFLFYYFFIFIIVAVRYTSEI